MSQQNPRKNTQAQTTDSSSKTGKTASKRSSSIVYKPFATGTLNFFTPHKNKNNSNSSTSKLVVNAILEDSELPVSEFNYHTHWIDRLNLLSPWKITAISIFLLANITSAIAIIFNHQAPTNKLEASNSLEAVGGSNLADKEFVELDLKTLSKIAISPNNSDVKVDDLSPIKADISPHQAIPPNNIMTIASQSWSTIKSKYYYVLTEYTGNQSLEYTKQKVDTVSLVEFPQGMFIYLGAFVSKSNAEKFVDRIKQEGINSYIYPY